MVNINSQTGIRYGTIYGNDARGLMEHIFDHGTDETFEAHKRECEKTMAAALEECGQRNAERQAKDIVGEFDWDHYESDESEYSYEDREGNKFLMSYLGGAPLIWCIKTSRIVKVHSLCSPCVPNAGDLSSGEDENGYECYGIPDQYQDAE